MPATLPPVVVLGQNLSQLDLLLQQQFTPKAPTTAQPAPTEFERLIQRQGTSNPDLERMLKKPFTPGESNVLKEVVVKGNRLRKFVRPAGRAVARLAPPVALFLGVYDILDFVAERYKRPPKVQRYAKWSANPDAAPLASPVGIIDPDSIAPVEVLGSRRVGDSPLGATTYDSLRGQSRRPSGRDSRRISRPRARATRDGDYNPASDSPTSSLTDEQGAGLEFLPKTQPRLVPPPDGDDRCKCPKQKRRKRDECPKSGYRTRIIKSEKIPCR